MPYVKLKSHVKAQCAAFMTIATRARVVHHAHGSTRGVAAAEREVDLTAHDRLDQLRVVVHRVLEVGVLDQDDVAGRVLEPLAHGGALPRGASCRTTDTLGRSRTADDRRGVPSVELLSTTTSSIVDVADLEREYPLDRVATVSASL